MTPSILAFLLLLFCFPLLSFAERLPETILRIGILRGVPSARIGAEGSPVGSPPSREGRFVAVDLSNGRKETFPVDKIYLARSAAGGIVLGDRDLGPQLRLMASVAGSRLTVNGRRYRDSLLIQSGGSRLTVINELGIEGYLYGVLPREVSPHWPAEALKAQAVVSRTYALWSLGKHGDEGFDMASDVSAQVYGGVENESANTSKAVDGTRGEVLVHSGDLIPAYFHACCGGHTESDFNGTPGVRDRHCAAVYPRFSWKENFSLEQLAAALGEIEGRETGTVRSVQILRRSRSGRTRLLKVRTAGGAYVVETAPLRRALGSNRFRSSYLTRVIQRADGFEFYGRGWGHGVGLCQWGMKALGERGWNYKKILRFYFPAARVEKWTH